MNKKDTVKHEYSEVLEIVFDQVEKTGSFRPLKLLFGKRVFGAHKPIRFYGTLLDYVRFCRLNKLAIKLTGEEY